MNEYITKPKTKFGNLIFVSDFNEETGVSTVTLKTKIGNFTGTAQLAEEDREYTSRFFGCRIAEIRANIKYFSETLKRKKLEMKGMKQICEAIDSSIITTDKNDLRPAARIAKKNYNKKYIEIKEIENIIISLKKAIPTLIDERDKYIQTRKGKNN